MRKKTKVCRWYCRQCDKYYNPPGRIREFICPDCKSKTEIKCVDKNLVGSNRGECYVDMLMRDNPRWSWAMGVNWQDIPRMLKKYPDREYHPKTGQLLVRNRAHKKRLMREHNMDEYN